MGLFKLINGYVIMLSRLVVLLCCFYFASACATPGQNKVVSIFDAQCDPLIDQCGARNILENGKKPVQVARAKKKDCESWEECDDIPNKPGQAKTASAKPLSAKKANPGPTPTSTKSRTDYLIGPGDRVQIFVWRNPEVSVTVPVRPDGKISTPLVEDMKAVGKTPHQLARDIEKILRTYIREPVVTVIVSSFGGPYSQQIRIVGQATRPQTLAYKQNMSVLDVIIAVGGLTEFAAGNKARIVRKKAGKQSEIRVRLDDLVKKGDISANVPMQPGDILIIPESWF